MFNTFFSKIKIVEIDNFVFQSISDYFIFEKESLQESLPVFLVELDRQILTFCSKEILQYPCVSFWNSLLDQNYLGLLASIYCRHSTGVDLRPGDIVADETNRINGIDGVCFCVIEEEVDLIELLGKTCLHYSLQKYNKQQKS